jgi:phosphoribosylanthranilate isomerase
MLKVKVCGMTNPANVKEVAEAGPDFMGFIFYPRSPWYVGQDPNPELFNNVPAGILKVGVFVNEDPVTVIEIAAMNGLDLVQLHGTETPDYCESLKLSGVKIIKAFGICDYTDFDIYGSYIDVCDYFLFDTRNEKYGGSGEKFNWEIVAAYKLDKPFFVSGGIGPDDAMQLKGIQNEKLMAVDVNIRFETATGIKDALALKSFIQEIQNMNIRHHEK